MLPSPYVGVMMRTLPLRCSFGIFDNLLKLVIFHMVLKSLFCYAKKPQFSMKKVFSTNIGDGIKLFVLFDNLIADFPLSSLACLFVLPFMYLDL
jgi:hypothetical protein